MCCFHLFSSEHLLIFFHILIMEELVECDRTFFLVVFLEGGRVGGLASVTQNTEKGWVTTSRDFFLTKNSACDGQPLFTPPPHPE